MKSFPELSILRSEKGRISGIQSLGGVDGPGVRAVVFGVGCPLRCAYCHNPETWAENGEEITAGELADKLLRYKPYFANGGVTFSGGEPLAQAKFFSAVATLLKAEGVHIATDTSGSVKGEWVDRLINKCDLLLCDVKFTSEEDYKKYTGGSLSDVLEFIQKVCLANKRLWIRQVIVEGVNADEENALKLKKILAPYMANIDKIELLPFRKLCLEKYERLGLTFPFADKPETSSQKIKELEKIFSNE